MNHLPEILYLLSLTAMLVVIVWAVVSEDRKASPTVVVCRISVLTGLALILIIAVVFALKEACLNN